MIGVVCHDAGGAEMVSSYVRREKLAAAFALEGPARAIFARKLGVQDVLPIEDVIERADWVLCGSGWQTDFEWRGIELARGASKRVVTMLDHWSNYRDRFERHGKTRLPDEVWVGDEPSVAIARAALPELPVRLVPNPYFADLQDEIAAARGRSANRDPGVRVLYLTEPTAEHCRVRFGNERHRGYTEFDALQYFFAHRDAAQLERATIVLRPHPAEPRTKYASLLAAERARFSEIPSLIDDILASDVVVGCSTSAMVIALLAGKRVICSIPPGGDPSGLPFPAIEQLPAPVDHAS